MNTHTQPSPPDTQSYFAVNMIRYSVESQYLHQVMEWRTDQARRDEEAKGLMSEKRHDVRKAVNVSNRAIQGLEWGGRFDWSWIWNWWGRPRGEGKGQPYPVGRTCGVHFVSTTQCRRGRGRSGSTPLPKQSPF